MQRFVGSSIAVRKNRFKETGAKFVSVPFNSIAIGNSFNSINIVEEYYTNYVNTSNQKVYKIISDFYLKYSKNENNLFGDYLFDELYYNGNNIERLIRIINRSNNTKFDKGSLTTIYKLKNKKEPKIHFYVQIVNNSMSILLIDLYHLSIPGDIYQKGKIVKKILLGDLPVIYNKYKNYTYNLNNVINSYSYTND